MPGVQRGVHARQAQPLGRLPGGEGLGHRARLDRVPQVDHQKGRRGSAAQQLGHEVVADGTGHAVVRRAHLGPAQDAEDVAHHPLGQHLTRGAHVVVDRDGVRMAAQQPVHHGGAGAPVQARDQGDGGTVPRVRMTGVTGTGQGTWAADHERVPAPMREVAASSSSVSIRDAACLPAGAAVGVSRTRATASYRHSSA